jgi:hypothetical protein
MHPSTSARMSWKRRGRGSIDLPYAALRIDEVRDTGLLATTMSLLGVCVAANQILGNTKGGQQLDALVAEYQS